MSIYSDQLYSQDCLEFQNVYIVTNAVIGGAGMIGYSFAFTADFNKVNIGYVTDQFLNTNV